MKFILIGAAFVNIFGIACSHISLSSEDQQIRNRDAQKNFRKTVLSISSKADAGVILQTTIFEPDGFELNSKPIVFINHGTDAKKEAQQSSEHSIRPTNYFLSLGMAVVLPMRRGYAGSTGEPVRVVDGDLISYGIRNAIDIKDVIDYVANIEKFKNRKIIVIGQSTGGLASLAYSSLPGSRADAVINFHGGMRPKNLLNDEDPWLVGRQKAFVAFASTSKPKSLWIYTANDHSSTPKYIGGLYKAFTEAGGSAELHQLEAFSYTNKKQEFVDDGHYLFDVSTGQKIWIPLVEKYLKEQGVYSFE